jgi:hypothetical protein
MPGRTLEEFIDLMGMIVGRHSKIMSMIPSGMSLYDQTTVNDSLCQGQTDKAGTNGAQMQLPRTRLIHGVSMYWQECIQTAGIQIMHRF